ncbi:MAG: hypothetical protein RSA84_24195, partial [Acinetobacter sp.]
YERLRINEWQSSSGVCTETSQVTNALHSIFLLLRITNSGTKRPIQNKYLTITGDRNGINEYL